MKLSEITPEGVIATMLILIILVILKPFEWIIFIGFLIICCITFFILFLQWFVPNWIDSHLEKTDKILEGLKDNSLIELDKISEILASIESVKGIISKAKILRYIGHIWRSKKIILKINGYAQYIENNILYILYHLRKELHIQLERYRSNLIQAKSSLSTHIHGTNELNNVSALQQARLDKQIEQFEELQRVLVKI